MMGVGGRVLIRLVALHARLVAERSGLKLVVGPFGKRPIVRFSLVQLVARQAGHLAVDVAA